MKKKPQLITKLGIIDRNNLEFWNSLFTDYLANKYNSKELSEYVGLDSRTILNIFNEYGWTRSEKTHLKTKVGYLSKDDSEDWKTYHNLYLDGKNLSDLSTLIGIERKTLTSYFKKFNFELRDMSDSVKLAQDKVIETNLARYGTYFPMQNTDVRNKSIEKVKEKYGTANIAKVPEIKDKIKSTNMERYGVSYSLKNTDIRNKSKQTMLDKYGSDNYKTSQYFKNKIVSKYEDIWKVRLSDEGYELLEEFTGGKNNHKFKKYKIKHTSCGNIFESRLQNIPSCPICNGNSKPQVELFEFIRDLGFNVVSNDKSILNGKELDLYLPDLKIAFEYNGLYWHREDIRHRNYHREKSEECLKKGVKLYHIWDCDDTSIIKSKIRNILKIVDNKYRANKLKIKLVNSEDRSVFMGLNHLHGDCNSTFSLGLYDGEELVQCLSWKLKDRYSMENIRLATKKDTRVDFGFSKLLKHSIDYIKNNHTEVNKLITFAYRDWTPDKDNNVYINNGFEFIHDCGAMLYYTDGRKLFNRQKYMKYKLKDLFPETFDENLTEKEILLKNNIYAIYNSGNLKYEKDI